MKADSKFNLRGADLLHIDHTSIARGQGLSLGFSLTFASVREDDAPAHATLYRKLRVHMTREEMRALAERMIRMTSDEPTCDIDLGPVS